MELKRNVLAIIYTIAFLPLMVFGLFQILNVTISSATNRYIMTGIIVLGLIVYLIIAYFIKGKRALRVVEKSSALLNLLEFFLVVVGVGLLFLAMYPSDMTITVVYMLLAAATYVVARCSGGRLCGVLALAATVTLILVFDIYPFLNVENGINMLCFLLPFALYLALHRVMIPAMGTSIMVLLFGYIVLSFVFSLAIAMNPLVSVLFIGCIFSLLFAKPLKNDTKLTNGIYLGGLFFLFTVGFVAVIYFFMPELINMPTLNLDRALNFTQINLDMITSVFNKYKQPILYLILPFESGIVPTLLFFFTVLAAYYGLTKKVCNLSPLIFSYVCLSVYYVLFCEGGTAFCYMMFFLPIFAGYGLSNTLLSDEEGTIVSNDQPITEQIQESVEELTETPAEEMQAEEPQEEEPSVEEPPVEEVGEPEPLQQITPIPNVEETTEDITDAQPVEEETLPDEAKDKKKQKRQSKKNISIVSLGKETADEIPEWTISESFLAEQEKMTEMLTEDVEVDPPASVIPEPENVENIVDIPEAQPEAEQEINDFKEMAEEPIESFPTSETNDNEIVDGIDLDSFVQENVVEEDDYSSLASTEPENEESQLSELLDRLDMSEPIKRMSETAQEDMADVIEREEEQVELSEALPLNPSKSTLPKYKKPDFDMPIEPMTIPLDDAYSHISEYDEVPTINDLESQWKENEPVIETVATTIETTAEPTTEPTTETASEEVHTENIVKKNGMNKRSYHRITIR